MRIPSRHVPKPKPKQESKKEPVVERVVETKDNSVVILAEVKRLLGNKPKAPTYIFDILRDADGRPTQVIARPLDTDTIL